MINFSNEDIKKSSAKWSLNEDIKLLDKLKILDELISSKTKNTLNNINKIDEKISEESILIKNLINDFYLIGHKQFTENRVQNKEDIKSLTSIEEENFDKIDLVSLDDQVKYVLDKSLNFFDTLFDKDSEVLKNNVDEKNIFESHFLDNQLNYLINKNKFNAKELPIIIGSDEFDKKILKHVQDNLNTKKENSKISYDLISNTDTSSISSDFEKTSINEKILEINEKKFLENLLINNEQKIEENKSLKKDELISVINKNLDPSQRKSSLVENKVEKINRQDSIKNELDSIFGKTSIISKNKEDNLFEDDLDDELFIKPQSHNIETKREINLFDSKVNFTENKFEKKISLIDSDKLSNSTESEDSNSVLDLKTENLKKKNLIENLFDSDIEDSENQLFTNSLLKDNNTSTLEKDFDKKMSNKDLFKNQLENLFAKKNSNLLFKNKENDATIESKKIIDKENIIPKEDKINKNETKVIEVKTNTPSKISEINQTNSNSMLNDINTINTSVLDNNYVKSRIKFNRKHKKNQNDVDKPKIKNNLYDPSVKIEDLFSTNLSTTDNDKKKEEKLKNLNANLFDEKETDLFEELKQHKLKKNNLQDDLLFIKNDQNLNKKLAYNLQDETHKKEITDKKDDQISKEELFVKKEDKSLENPLVKKIDKIFDNEISTNKENEKLNIEKIDKNLKDKPIKDDKNKNEKVSKVDKSLEKKFETLFLSDDSEDSDDLFESLKTNTKSLLVNKKTDQSKPNKEEKVSNKIKNLFDDDSDDELLFRKKN